MGAVESVPSMAVVFDLARDLVMFAIGAERVGRVTVTAPTAGIDVFPADPGEAAKVAAELGLSEGVRDFRDTGLPFSVWSGSWRGVTVEVYGALRDPGAML